MKLLLIRQLIVCNCSCTYKAIVKAMFNTALYCRGGRKKELKFLLPRSGRGKNFSANL